MAGVKFAGSTRKEYQEEQEGDWKECKKRNKYQYQVKENSDERFNLNEDQNRAQLHT